MNDTDLTPRDSLAHARSAILDLHALLKIMEGATSVPPRASDWGDFPSIPLQRLLQGHHVSQMQPLYVTHALHVYMKQ